MKVKKSQVYDKFSKLIKDSNNSWSGTHSAKSGNEMEEDRTRVTKSSHIRFWCSATVKLCYVTSDLIE